MNNIHTYSRKSKVEERKNMRKAFLFGLLTIGAIVLFAFYGLGTLAKFVVFLGDLKKGNQPVQSDDTTPPIPPRFEPIPKETNKNNLDVKGSTEPGATVILVLNGRDYELLANNEGEFSFSANLVDGDNVISAFSQDNAGNKSNKTETQTVILDTSAPSLDITKPQDGSSYYGSKERQLVIEGKTEEEAKVSINGRNVVVETGGVFTFLTTLSEGTNALVVKAEDQAGNITEKTLTVMYSP